MRRWHEVKDGEEIDPSLLEVLEGLMIEAQEFIAADGRVYFAYVLPMDKLPPGTVVMSEGDAHGQERHHGTTGDFAASSDGARVGVDGPTAKG